MMKVRVSIIVIAVATNSAQDSDDDDSLDDFPLIKDILFKVKHKEAFNLKRKAS
jgi:hypothetical protein